MSELLDLEVMHLGTKVAIVDDSEQDGEPLKKGLSDLNISNRFFRVDYAEPNFPAQPLKDVEIIFLDLYFNEGYGVEFDPYICINWIDKIVTAGQKYAMVIWSRDIEQKEMLLETMREVSITMPYYTLTRNKGDYRIMDNQYGVRRLLDDIGKELRTALEVQSFEYYGEILEVEEDAVLVNCLIDEASAYFEVRRFELLPFKNFIEPEAGKFVRIRVITKPGSTSIEFSPENSDLSARFANPGIENFGDISWLNTPEE